MFIQIPMDMDEVMMRQLQLKKMGQDRTEDELIQAAVLDIFQADLDEIEDGRYDTASWQDGHLVVTDIFKAVMGTVAPPKTSFIEDFRTDADATIQYLLDQAIKLVGGR